MFGAVADGVTDDTVAIQAAIDALPTNTQGSPLQFMLFFPPGRYLVTDMLLIQHLAGTIFYGSGMWESIIYYNGAAGKRAIVKVYNCRDVTFKDLQITPNLSLLANAPDLSLEIEGDVADPDIGPLSSPTRFMCYRCFFYGGRKATVAHTYPIAGPYSTNDQCYFENCTMNAADVNGAAAYSLGNGWESPGQVFSNMKRMTFVHCMFNAMPTNLTTYGFRSYGGSYTLRDCVINFALGFYQDRQGEQVQLDNVYSEVCDQFIKFKDCGATPIKITSCQVDPTVATAAGTINGVDVTYPFIFENTVGPIEIDSCQIGTAYTQLAQIRIVTNGGNIGGEWSVSVRNTIFNGTAGNGTGSRYIGGVSVDAIAGRLTLEDNVYIAEGAAQHLQYFLDHDFNPNQITDLQGYWDGQFPDDVTLSGTDIIQIANHAGTAGASLDITDLGNAGQRPTYDAVAQRFDFDGTQWLQSGAYALNQPTTFRMCGFWAATTAINSSWTDGRALNTRQFSLSSPLNFNLIAYAGVQVNTGIGITAPVGITAQQRLIGATFDGLNGSIELNGYPLTTGNIGTAAASGITIGSRNAGAQVSTGSLFWFAIWSRDLTPAEDGCLAASMPHVRLSDE